MTIDRPKKCIRMAIEYSGPVTAPKVLVYAV